MKKIFFVFAFALAMVSCSDRQAPMVEWSFQASYSTKASIDAGSGAFSWKGGDKIAVWNETSASFVQFSTPAGKGKFSALAPADAHFTSAAFYPATAAKSTGSVSLPASYSSPEEAAAGFVMKADVPTDGNDLSFKHLGAVLVVNLAHLGSNMDRITVRSSAASLSGDFAVTDGEVRAASGSSTVTVHFVPMADQSLSIAVPVPVGTYPFTVSLGNETQPDAYTIESDGSLNFERAHLYRLVLVDLLYNGVILPVGDTVEDYTLENDTNNWE